MIVVESWTCRSRGITAAAQKGETQAMAVVSCFLVFAWAGPYGPSLELEVISTRSSWAKACASQRLRCMQPQVDMDSTVNALTDNACVQTAGTAADVK